MTNRAKGPLDNSESIDDFRPPCLNKIETTFPDGAKTILALYATPTKPGYARHIGAQVLIKSEQQRVPAGLGFYALPLPAWFLHMAAAFFLHQDQVFLHHQQHQLYSSRNYAFGHFDHVNTSSAVSDYYRAVNIPNINDRGIALLRKWIATVGGGGPRWGGSAGVSLGKSMANLRALSETLPSRELFNVYQQHTKDCVICQRALKNIQAVKTLSIAGLIALAMRVTWLRKIRLSHVLMGILLGSTSMLTRMMAKLFHVYEFHHQRNN